MEKKNAVDKATMDAEKEEAATQKELTFLRKGLFQPFKKSHRLGSITPTKSQTQGSMDDFVNPKSVKWPLQKAVLSGWNLILC